MSTKKNIDDIFEKILDISNDLDYPIYITDNNYFLNEKEALKYSNDLTIIRLRDFVFSKNLKELIVDENCDSKIIKLKKLSKKMNTLVQEFIEFESSKITSSTSTAPDINLLLYIN